MIMFEKDNVIVKVGGPGSGKSAWLRAKVEEETAAGNPCYYLTDQQVKWENFCKKYLDKFEKHCPLSLVNYPDDLPNNAVVIVDDLFKLFDDGTIRKLFYLVTTGRRIYITINGDNE